MANYANLKATINANIKANGAEEITGPILNNVLNAAVNALGAGWQYMGVATPATSPGTPDSNMFYIASTAGTYTNFGSLVVAEGEVAVLKYNGTWTKEVTGAATAAQVTQLEAKEDNIDSQLNGGEFTKNLVWTDGYISSTGTINASTASKFTQPFLLKRGESVSVGTNNSNIIIIGTTTATSLAVGDSVTAIQKTTSGNFETHNFTATEDTIIVLCVSWEGHTLSFDNGNPLAKQVETIGEDSFISGIVAKDFPVTAYVDFDINIPSGSIINSLGQFPGTLYLNYKTEGSSYPVTTSRLPYAVPFNVTTARSSQTGTISIHLAKIADGVKDGAVSLRGLGNDVRTEINSKVTQKAGKNLFNLADPNYTPDKSMYGNGTEYASNTTNITAYIPVKASTAYTISGKRTGGYLVNNIHAYNSAKTHLSQIQTGDLSVNHLTFTTPENASFIRITIRKINWLAECNYMLEEGDEKTMTIPYNPTGGYLLEEYGDGCHCFLPKDIYVATGRTIEIYYEQVVLHAERYNIKASCAIGIPLERKFQIIGNESFEGNDYTLTLEIMDDDYNVYRTLTSTIHCVANTIAENKVILPIGTSLTNGKPWLPELSILSDKLSFVGTRIGNNQVRHEGRSGATCEFYNTDNILYTFDDSYCGVGYDSSEFSSATAYAVGNYCWRTVNGKKVVYKFVNAHSGAWSDADAINISQTNPFWDLSSGEVSITSYKSSQGITFDAIIVELGANGINDTPMTNPNGALGIKNFVDAIREGEPTIPIIIVNPMFQSSQNGIGRQGNTDGYSAVSEYKYHTDRMHLDLAKATEKMLSGYEGVFYCPIPQTHDSKYNFGNTKVQVNPRIDSTDVVYELQPVDSIHPQTPGYMQMADEIFSILCYIFGQ